MLQIQIDPILQEAAPDLKLLVLEASVKNAPTPDGLWEEIEKMEITFRNTYTIDQINKRPAIWATRQIYKKLGKDPNRYRPSAEALSRRIVNGKGIYRLDSLIDIINLLSVESGYSIGGFDRDKIQGDSLVLGRGQAGETFSAIGRGLLNIEGLPVFRDARGPIGTPTSDEIRTCLTPSTSRLLMIVNIYGEEIPDDLIISRVSDLLRKYASATDIEIQMIARPDY